MTEGNQATEINDNINRERMKTTGKSMLKNMLNSLIKYEQIKTTLPKAKFLKPQADKIITLGKKETLQTMHALTRGLIQENIGMFALSYEY